MIHVHAEAVKSTKNAVGDYNQNPGTVITNKVKISP